MKEGSQTFRVLEAGNGLIGLLVRTWAAFQDQGRTTPKPVVDAEAESTQLA